MNDLPSFRFDRRIALSGGLAWLAAGFPAYAQQGRAPDRRSMEDSGGGQALSPEKLEALISEALSKTSEIQFARPWILGYPEGKKLVTRQVKRTIRGADYYSALAVPREDDGIMFFRGTDKPLSFAMHRTGTHLRRLVSALNKDGNLNQWSGPEADADFQSQLAAWA
jgi:hypothetical protein